MSYSFEFSPHNTILRFFLLLTVIFAGSHEIANAADLVSGKYLSANGTSLVLRLTIQHPAPANLIVEQSLAPGNLVTSTSPQARKIDNTKHKVKWLFRNIRSGKITLSTRLKTPLTGHPKAMIRYRDPQSGSFTEIRISP